MKALHSEESSGFPASLTSSPDAATAEISDALVDVASYDSEFRDVYLRRALSLLAPVMPPERVSLAERDERRLHELRNDAEHAIVSKDWAAASALAREAEALGRVLGSNVPILRAGRRLYGALDEPPGPRGIAAVTLGRGTLGGLRACLTGATSALATLEQSDPDLRSFYAERRRALRAQLPEADSYDHLPEATLQGEALRALKAGDWRALMSIASRFVSQRGADGPAGACQCGALPDSSPTLDEPIALREPAANRGLVDVTVEADARLRAYLACRCAAAPAFSDDGLVPDVDRSVAASCGCVGECGDLPPRLRENLDLLKHRIFVTSLGTRYLPTFQRERLLVESFADDDARRGPLLERLGLRCRDGLARRDVDRALIAHGADVLRELGLDPVEFVVTVVPFDVYLRLAPTFGWGTRNAWTHLDGYQVLRGWHLRSLVGGHRRFGGERDLCSLGAAQEYEGVRARLAVVRRGRLRHHLGAAARPERRSDDAPGGGPS